MPNRYHLAVLALLLAGCSSSQPPAETAKVTKEGVDVKKDPLGMLGALASAGKDLEKMQKELEEMPATDPVHFSKLIEALPDVPSGWTADEAKGASNQMGDFKTSQGSRRYRTESGESVDVEINDWAFNRALYLPFFMQAKFSQETTDGYSKGITMGEDPGREEYNIKQKDGSRQVLYKKRYHIKVAVNNMPSEAIEEWGS
ncbi:MAG: hypothetical protein R2762_28750 [Bryobacteraceae bacterium]